MTNKMEQAKAIFTEVEGNYDQFRAKVMEAGLLSGMGAQTYYYGIARDFREQAAIESAHRVADDFKAYLANLEQSDLVELLTNLIHDDDGLNTKTMKAIMKRSGVEAYK